MERTYLMRKKTPRVAHILRPDGSDTRCKLRQRHANVLETMETITTSEFSDVNVPVCQLCVLNEKRFAGKAFDSMAQEAQQQGFYNA